MQTRPVKAWHDVDMLCHMCGLLGRALGLWHVSVSTAGAKDALVEDMLRQTDVLEAITFSTCVFAVIPCYSG